MKQITTLVYMVINDGNYVGITINIVLSDKTRIRQLSTGGNNG